MPAAEVAARNAQGCPLWSRCPRHHGARDLVTAQVWVATPASLVHSAVPPHQTDARIRYLELACRMQRPDHRR